MRIRTLTPEDYAPIISVVDAWWGGRTVAAMLPRLFFSHFRDTGFIAEVDGQRIGFLAGFLSPALSDEAYIHFVGVDPNHRKCGVARTLYEWFFRIAMDAGRRRVKCVTSPANAPSIAFHRAMGFRPEEAVGAENGMVIHPDYDGPGEARVVLVREL